MTFLVQLPEVSLTIFASKKNSGCVLVMMILLLIQKTVFNVKTVLIIKVY